MLVCNYGASARRIKLTEEYLDPRGISITIHSISEQHQIERRFRQARRVAVRLRVIGIRRLRISNAVDSRPRCSVNADGVIRVMRRHLGPDGRVKVQVVPAVGEIVPG